MKQPYVVDFKYNSLDDGPGIRTVVFLKGCPLSCVWCHNPESISQKQHLSYDKSKCLNLEKCTQVCSENAIDISSDLSINRENCSLCMACVEACPSEALNVVGKMMSAKEIVEEVNKFASFYQNSGGGVTLSGGEPTMYMDFCSSLLSELKERKLHTLIQTCGQFQLSGFLQKAYPYLDLIYYDIKIMDSDDHKNYCGVSNQLILDNFSDLFSRSISGGVKVIPRIPLIPDITTSDQNLREIARFLQEKRVKEVALLSYNPIWSEKLAKIGKPQEYDETKWLEKEEEDHFRSFFEQFTIYN